MDIYGDAAWSLEQIINTCVRERATLKLAGDIFDTALPPSSSVDVFRKQMDRMQKAELPVFIIQGQHDKSDPPWPAAIHPIVQHVHAQTFYAAADYCVYGLDYLSSADLEVALANVPPQADTLMLHQMARPVFDLPGAWNLDPAWIPQHVKRVLIGDYHGGGEFTLPSGGVGRYTGSMHVLAHDELKNKSFLLETVRPDGTVHIEQVALHTRPYVNVTLRRTEDLEEFLTAKVPAIRALAAEAATRMPAHVARPVILLAYAADIAGVEKRVRAALDEVAHIWPMPQSMRIDEAVVGAMVPVAASDLDLPQVLAQVFGQGDEAQLALELLEGKPAGYGDILTTYRQKYEVTV